MVWGTPKTQGDIVKADREEYQQEVEKDRLVTPGIKDLHTASSKDIAETLTQVVRARPNIISFKWVIGSHIEIEYKPVN